ncbi:hypothetical protein RUR49_13865 [Pseudoxanthobacter sp. M-2]|uniref:hypothetical protein n=1 Tax=Pseudoxanthobacter sp. M-2 TaxID=3078754 RepID=UPI0038FC3EFA
MKRQARPFVVETKRSRKAPTNLWASTPLLQQELAAASEPEPQADAIFTERLKERVAEPVRRILQSLLVEAPSPVIEALESEEAREAEAQQRRAERTDDAGGGAAPSRRGRPRRAAAPVEAEPAGAVSPPAAKAPREVEARSRKQAGLRAPKAEAAVVRVTPPASQTPSEPVVPSTKVAGETDGTAGQRTGRARVARNPVAAALLPGERWKRRLPQRLW